MNNNIIEIINILIKKVLESKNPVIHEEDIIQELMNMGYEIDDIDQALELIFNEKIVDEDIEDEICDNYNRIFTISERVYIPVKIQGLIRRLMYLNVLSAQESETLIARTVQNSYNGISQTVDIWEILQEIIEDKFKLEILLCRIPEFKKLYGNKYEYLN